MLAELMEGGRSDAWKSGMGNMPTSKISRTITVAWVSMLGRPIHTTFFEQLIDGKGRVLQT